MEEDGCEYYCVDTEENKSLTNGQITKREVYSCGNLERLSGCGYTKKIAYVCRGALTKCPFLNK